MPLYEYECDECAYKLEELRSVNDRERPEACPVCENGFIRLTASVIANTPARWGDSKKYYHGI